MSLRDLIVNNSTPTAFSALPRAAQKALIQYGALESSDYYTNELQEFLDATILTDHYQLTESDWDTAIQLVSARRVANGEEETFHYAELDTGLVCDALCAMKPEFMTEHGSFDAYHQWYMGAGTLSYPITDRYPVLAWCNEEGIMDGWHRFHSYIRDKHPTIPLIF